MDDAARQVAAYERPAEIILVEALPAASTGKILKHRLWDAAARADMTLAHVPIGVLSLWRGDQT